MAGTIRIEVAPGELVDKLTILDIKLARISDAAKLHNVALEQTVLRAAYDDLIDGSFDDAAIARLRTKLHTVNERLWVIEDEIRDCERRSDFGAPFVGLARAVYKANDERAAIKRAINVALGSRLIEEKSYAAYA